MSLLFTPSSAPVYHVCTSPGMFSPLLIPSVLVCHSAPPLLPHCFSQLAAPPLHHFHLFPLALDPPIHPSYPIFNSVPSARSHLCPWTLFKAINSSWSSIQRPIFHLLLSASFSKRTPGFESAGHLQTPSEAHCFRLAIHVLYFSKL